MAERSPYTAPRFGEALRPQASPVDTFVNAPQIVRGNPLEDLAQGLSKFDAGLGSFLAERKKQKDEEDRILGEAEFHKNNQTGFAEGVANGSIPPDRSKSFMEGYKQAQGNIAGYGLEQRFRATYDKWEGRGDPDPAKFETFLQGFLAENIKTNDPQVLRGLVPRLRSLVDNSVSRAEAERSKRLTEGNLNAGGAEAGIVMDGARRQALQAKKPIDTDGMLNQLDGLYTSYLSRGTNPDDMQKKLVDAVTAKVWDNPGSARDLMKFFDRKVPGQNYTWGDLPYGRDQKAKTLENLETLAAKEMTRGEAERKRKLAEQEADITRRAIGSLAANPDAPFPEDLLKEGEKLIPDFRTKVNTWRSNIRDNAGAANPEALRDLNWEIIQSGGKGVEKIIQRGMENGVINNAQTLRDAQSLGERMQKDGAKFEGLRSGASAQNIVATIKQRTLSKDDLGNPFAPGGMSDVGLAARYDFERMVLEWSAKNPNATALEQEEAIGKIGSTILGRLQRADEGTGAATYNRQGIGGTNPYTPQAPAPGAPPAPPPVPTPGAPPPASPSGGPSPAPTPGAPAPKDAVEWYNSLPPETKQRAADRSLQTGQPLRQILEEGFRRAYPQQAPTNPPAAAPSPTSPQRQSSLEGDIQSVLASFSEDDPVTQEMVQSFGRVIENALRGQGGGNTESYTLAALRDDPRAARILDFISGPESGGNYNAVFGRGKSNHDLSQYTVAEIVAGKHLNAIGGKVRGQSATGRYQFINKTLRGLVDEVGLTGSERFTPELQDKLAIQLLKRRGYDRFASGKMSMETFANNLAMEWASLPNLRTGRSHYAGDGLNASHVTPQQVVAALSGDPKPKAR
jgi:muramidase (phage lysozyme)